MIRIGIVGTGGMAHAHASAFGNIRGCKITACCDIDAARAASFAEQFQIPDIYTNYGSMLADAKIDAISTPTPDALHAPVSIAGITAGKHVLCEKPLATSYAEARRMVSAAKRKGVVNMVNLSYRDAPAIQKAAKIIHSGKLGRVRHVQASYLQGWLTGKHWGDWRSGPNWLWRLSTRHGSMGALGDLGVHIVDFASFPVGPVKQVSCLLKTLPKAPRGRIGQYRLDANDTAAITVEFANGAVGNITATRWATGRVNSLTLSVHCDKGALEVDLDRSTTTLMLCSGKDVDRARWKEVPCPHTPNIYQRFIKSIQTGTKDQPDFARGADIQTILDACVRSNATGRAVRV
ncbi:MAG: Gfo/Idh/MocA family oxidoreductase [Lentisphaerales bacterium]|jgi:predicted dehydrogenase|nr:MAG: Gfo/Idh/MocA family oxidoreductase [Lentisphaerales bacterium]